MFYGDRQMIEGVPGDENTAVTIRAIKDILDDAGASGLLLTNDTDGQQSGPLRKLAARASGPGGLQMPPPVGDVRVRPMPSKEAAGKPRGGILPRLFGRK